MERISEEELVARFATDKQKQKYELDRKLTYDVKRGVLERAKKYCTVTPMPDGTFKLTNQKKIPITDNSRLASGVYPYTCPLILQYLIDNNYNGKVVLGQMSLARHIEMINEYYSAMNGNEWVTAREMDLRLRAVYDFFGHVTDSVNRMIKQTLAYLQQLKLIICKENYIVKWVDLSASGREVNMDITTSIATDKEMEIFTGAVKHADTVCEIEVANDRYNSSKAHDWGKALRSKLKEHGIMDMFPVYEIYAVDIGDCKSFRNNYGDSATLMANLGKEFRNNVYNNVLKRINKSPTSYEDFSDDLLFAYSFLSKICLGKPKVNKAIQQKLDNIVKIRNVEKYTLNVRENGNEV